MSNRSPRIANLHSFLSVHINSNEDLAGIEIVNMDWNHHILRLEIIENS